MFVPNLPMNEGLLVRSRLRTAVAAMAQTRLWELAWLIGMGVAAALAATFMDWSLGIPGHSIVRVVFPMSLGLALVPRRGAGVVMGASGLATVAVFGATGHVTPGVGAMTSLALTGPLLDAALWRARQGWMLYGGFALAGLVSNMIAFAVRGGGRLAGVGRASGLAGGGGRGLGGGTGGGMGGGGLGAAGVDPWWSYAPFTYLTCGFVAGLVCAAIWFAVRPRQTKSSEGPQS